MTAVTADSRLVADVLAGLWQHPPTLPARWFYDERGSRLFDEITRLPEYYPTRRETEILAAHSAEIAALTGATTLLELGSGMSTKTRLLLSAFEGQATLFVPLDVSAEVMLDAAAEIARDYPGIAVRPVQADFTEPLGELPGEPGRRLVAFLGGTIGNFDDDERTGFLRRIRDALAPGDHFLLGADLIKSPSRLVAAYDDAAGVTAAFNRNMIEVLRTELDADGLFADDFEHVARWNPQRHRMEMWLRARRDVHARLRAIDRVWDFPAGAEMRTEVSTKFDLVQVRAELDAVGLSPVCSWTDAAGDYSLTLAQAR